jgi:hypothetical protein
MLVPAEMPAIIMPAHTTAVPPATVVPPFAMPSPTAVVPFAMPSPTAVVPFTAVPAAAVIIFRMGWTGQRDGHSHCGGDEQSRSDNSEHHRWRSPRGASAALVGPERLLLNEGSPVELNPKNVNISHG